MSHHLSLSRAALFLALTVSGLAQPAAADDRTIRVVLDYARLVRLPEGTQTLVIGNPLVADVSMVKGNQLFVITGKSFGTTNLIVLDRSGQQVGESIVTVVPANDKVLVQRGVHRESLSCNPKCVTTVDLGDDAAYSQNAISAAKAHESAMNSK
ncbi:MAG: pilus assembly protein N-terminal domain-containing protein [Methylocystis sp.]|uniref:pilus assembly protein N-terminal domain-containing protein n=1 Tax=Methylocystis sp. TaxID=1911079 RepID=UPI003DA50718